MRYARIKFFLLLVIIVAAVCIVVGKGRISTDLSLFLPEPETEFDELLKHQLDSGVSSDVILVAFSGLDKDQLAAFSNDIVGKLSDTGIFSQVSNNVSQIGEDALAFLVDNRYLLSRNAMRERLSEAGLKSALAERLKGLASATASLEKKYLQRDPTGEVLALLGEWQGKISRYKRPAEHQGVWFSDDLTRAVVLLEIAADISRMENQENAVATLRRIYAQNRLPGMQAVMAGPAVFAIESAEDIKADVRYLTALSLAIVFIFLFSVYRSFHLVILIALPLATGVLVASACILLVYGNIHGITLAFGITLAGVAVDYPIHLLMGLKKDALSNPDRVHSLWRTLRLGVFSTLIAYAAFLVSGFSGLQQLGLFTIIGLMTAALFARWVLPFIAARYKYTVSNLGILHRVLKSAAQASARARWLVPCVLLGVPLALAFGERSILHLNVDSLSPINDQRRAEGRMLREDLGFWYGGSMMLITSADEEGVLQLSEEIEGYLETLVTEGKIEGFDMASHFLPSASWQAAQKAAFADVPGIRKNMNRALAESPFRPAVFEPFFDDLEKMVNLPIIDLVALDGSLTGKKLNSLLFRFADGAAGVVLLHGVSDETSMQQFADQHAGVYYMHLKTASTDLVARSVHRVAISMIGCIILIYLSLAFAFKSWIRPLHIMVPTFAAAVGTTAILVSTGTSLSIFHLISLLLVVGLGLDYGLFFNRLPDHQEEWETTFKSLWVCGITTIVVFGVLTISQTPPLAAIGETVSMGALISMVFAAMWSTRENKARAALD